MKAIGTSPRVGVEDSTCGARARVKALRGGHLEQKRGEYARWLVATEMGELWAQLARAQAQQMEAGGVWCVAVAVAVAARQIATAEYSIGGWRVCITTSRRHIMYPGSCTHEKMDSFGIQNSGLKCT